ncbi:MAG TPA: DUF4349 domain-containing protein [Pyrinomonadaceae bacterium]|nr:DUF4349 domain-containing protein [Pyrinomonadaceae bacterium]
MSFIKSLLLLALLSFGGCAQRNAEAPPTDRLESARSGQYASKEPTQDSANEAQIQKVSLSQADQSQSIAEAMNRKIIRNAELYLEIRDPAEGQRKITSIAESLGGFVVTSESKQSDTQDPTKKELEVNLVVRIPALQYNSALEQIRAVGNRVIQEKTSGQDVTEDFIDLEARIKTQKALELQFLEIMKQANKVGDALEIQRQIAEVRTEIEKLEGRKRFLENRASLSTITVSLRTPAAIAVNTAGFGRNVKIAVSDSFAIATAIVLFLIRFVIIMVPVALLIILPGVFLVRYLIRVAQRWKPASQSPSPESD